MTRLPAPHWPTIRGRARADAGPLLLSGVVVALVVLLAGAVPALLRAAADDAVRDAVAHSHGYADVTATAPWPADNTATGRIRSPQTAQELETLRLQALNELGPLHAILTPPVVTAISPSLSVAAEGPQRTFRLAYLSDGDGPRVTWIAGTEPGRAFPTAADDVEAGNAVPWLVRIGLSEKVATILGVRPGDRFTFLVDY
jgi:putative ABC transport system permease protein